MFIYFSSDFSPVRLFQPVHLLIPILFPPCMLILVCTFVRHLRVSLCMCVLVCNVKSAIFPWSNFRLSEKTKRSMWQPLIIVFTFMESRILGLNSFTKMKRWRNFTQDGFRENCETRVYFIAYIARRNLFHSSYWII